MCRQALPKNQLTEALVTSDQHRAALIGELKDLLVRTVLLDLGHVENVMAFDAKPIHEWTVDIGVA